MERKHKPIYSVELELCVPDFEGENRFVLLEKERAHKEMARIDAKPWGSLLKSAAGEPYRGTWQKYVHDLEHYKQANRHHRDLIVDGLVPVRFVVTNNSSKVDKNIAVRVEVEEGQFRLTSHAPYRPVTPEGLKEPDRFKVRHVVPFVGGFTRSKINAKARSLEATFSKLRGGDSALLVNRVVYVRSGEHTKLRFEIKSALAEESGKIAIEY
jgi:hypothetical protein